MLKPDQEPLTLNRRMFLASAALTAAAVLSLEDFCMGSEAAQACRLSSGRSMSYRLLGEGPHKIVLIHGFPGTSEQFAFMDEFFRSQGVSALAPDLYGRHTAWQQRSAVADAGRDIAELALHVHGAEARPVIVCVSGGAKDGLAACAELNRRSDGAGAPQLFVVSGQMDLGRSDVFRLLPPEKRFELDAIRGVPHTARIPLLQPLRNRAAALKQRIALRRIERLAANPDAAFQRITSEMSAAEDRTVLKNDPEFRNVLYREIGSYSAAELIDSLQRLFHWNIDFKDLRGTAVTIIHGSKDEMVHPDNARILEASLRRAGVENVRLLWYPEGHLLMSSAG